MIAISRRHSVRLLLVMLLAPLASAGLTAPRAGFAAAKTLPLAGATLMIALGDDEFLFAGIGLTISFEPIAGGQQAGRLSVEEGGYVDGRWQHLRWLNGDQTH